MAGDDGGRREAGGAAMKAMAALLTFLRSRTLTVWVLGLLVLYYLTIAVWSKEAFTALMAGLSKSYVVRSVYALLFLNVLVLTVDRARRELTASRARLMLRAPLYAGVLLFLCAFFLSLNIRQSVWLLRGEGDPVEFPWERSVYRVEQVTSALRERPLRREGSGIFDHEPSVVLVGRSGARHRITAFPPTKVDSTYLHVMNSGVGPGVELREKGRTLSQGHVALRLTPFGAVDIFTLPPYPYRFSLSILPNEVRTSGEELEREYDLSRPRYRVEVRRGDRVIARGETSTFLRFGDGLSLHFEPPYDWVLLEAVHDPFYSAYVASLLLLLAGAVFYPVSFLVGRRSNEAAKRA